MVIKDAPYIVKNNCGRYCIVAGCNLTPTIIMTGYAGQPKTNPNLHNHGDLIIICKFHAQQLARKLLEDICDLEGDRHG